MTEALEKAVRDKGVRVFDSYRVIKLFREGFSVMGFAAICPGLAESDPENAAGLCFFMSKTPFGCRWHPRSTRRAFIRKAKAALTESL